MSKLRAGAVLFVAAFLTTGCVFDVPVAAPATTSSSPTSTVPVTTSTTTTSRQTTTPPPVIPPYTPPPVPVDGNDLSACQDGMCEVRVTVNATINVGPGRPTFTVVKIGAAGVDFQLLYPRGNRATLNLGPESGAFAPFGPPMSFKISLYRLDDDGTAIVVVEPHVR